MKQAFLTTALLTGLATPAMGSIVMTINSQPTAGKEGFTTYTLNFTATEGLVGGFQGNFAGFSGFSGDLGQLKDRSDTTPTMDLAKYLEGDSLYQDSHFLLVNADLLPQTLPFESETSLGGAFTISESSRVESVDLIQIVVANDSPVNYDFKISEALGSTANSTNFAGTLPVPEPASLALASLGGLLIARRRRSA